MFPLEAEKAVGIETFLTDTPGVGGKIKTIPEDFIVEETSKYPPRCDSGKYLIAEVVEKNWETNRLIKEFSKRLNISKKRIGFAGTKDKRAETKRLMSFYDVSEEKIFNLKIKDVEIKVLYFSRKPIRIGDLVGNKFVIIIRNIDTIDILDKVRATMSLINDNSGFPNFFGIQRFGSIRPVTHLVGKYIIKGDFKKAVMTYLANPQLSEKNETYMLRQKLEEKHDFAEALKTYPDYLGFEKAILNKLVKNPDDFAGALEVLPRNLLTMFVYAYQSYLFNRVLSERIERKFFLNKAMIGDIVYPVRGGQVEKKPIVVKESNLEKINKQILKNKAVVTGVLFGYKTVLSEGEMGEIEKNVIEEEKLDEKDFIVTKIPYLSSKGSRRPLVAVADGMEYDLIEDELNPGKKALQLKFKLRKGCYATSFLRELMKADDIRNY